MPLFCVVTMCSNGATCCCTELASTIKINLVSLVQSGYHYHHHLMAKILAWPHHLHLHLRRWITKDLRPITQVQSNMFMQSSLLSSYLCYKVTFFLSCHKMFQMNWTFFKRSPVLKSHFSLSQRWLLNTGLSLHVFNVHSFNMVVTRTLFTCAG